MPVISSNIYLPVLRYLPDFVRVHGRYLSTSRYILLEITAISASKTAPAKKKIFGCVSFLKKKFFFMYKI